MAIKVLLLSASSSSTRARLRRADEVGPEGGGDFLTDIVCDPGLWRWIDVARLVCEG
jgi:hypothetical protein